MTATSTATKAPRRVVPTRSGVAKDLGYIVLLCILTVYHFYTQQVVSVGMESSIVSGNRPDSGGDDSSSFLPPSSSTRNTPILNKKQQSNSTSEEVTFIPLQELTAPSVEIVCPKGLTYLPNKVVGAGRTERRIPTVIHMTSKSRCFPPNFVENIRLWDFSDHDLYIHDDEAVERLFLSQSALSSFPHLSVARQCLRSGAGKADLWRYLVLWEYGGIYTDIDNAPGALWNSSIIAMEDDAFFVIEKLGVLSQYFMALSPRHPLMYFAIHVSLHRLLNLDHVGKQNIPVVTGPGALKVAFKYFMRTQEVLEEEDRQTFKKNNPNATRHGRVKAGTYVGVGGRSVRVAGTKNTGSKLVVRGSVDGKSAGYDQMGMRHFSSIAKKKFNESCLVHLYNLQHNPGAVVDLTNW